MVWTLQYTFVDEAGKSSKTQVNVPSAVTVANLQIYAGEMAKLLNAVTIGAITGITASLSIDVPDAVRDAAQDESRVSAGAYFGFETDAGFPTSMRIPTRDEAIITDGSIDVNQANTQVAALVDGLIDGIDLTAATPTAGTGTVIAVDKHGDPIVALRVAREQFVKAPKS